MTGSQKLLKQWTPKGDHLRSVGRSILLAGAVGIMAGVGAAALHSLCQLVVHLCLYKMAGYDQGQPAHEEMLFVEGALPIVPWVLVLLLPIGGLLSGWITHRFAPECSGGGVDDAIDAFHNRRGKIRTRVPFVKLIVTALTLGTGGSGGREGPIAQIGAGFGSYVATRLRLSAAERRVLMAAGLGAGIGAIFHAPLAGAIYAVEVLYRDPDFEVESLIPAFIATTLAYCVFNVFMNVAFGAEAYKPLFAVASDLHFRNPLLLFPLTALAGVMVVTSLIFARSLNTTRWLFERMSVRRWIKPAVGAGLTGLLAVALYYTSAAISARAQHQSLSVLSFGYGFLQDVLSGNLPQGFGAALAILLIVAIGKMASTALTIGSGGSGGVFGPSMVIGGSLGAIVGMIFHKMMPDIVRVDIFAILGMAAFFAAAANTPVGTLIMVTEMTASYELLLPAMWVCALSYLLSRGWTIYHTQVPTRVDSPAHRGDYLVDVLQGLRVRQALNAVGRQFVTVLPGMLLQDVVHLFTDTKQTCFPVVDREGKYYGLISLHDVRQFLYDAELGELAVAHDLATPAEALDPEQDLNSAIRRFAGCHFDELPVTDPEEPGRIAGMLRRQDLIAAYNTKMIELRKEPPSQVTAW